MSKITYDTISDPNCTKQVVAGLLGTYFVDNIPILMDTTMLMANFISLTLLAIPSCFPWCSIAYSSTPIPLPFDHVVLNIISLVLLKVSNANIVEGSIFDKTVVRSLTDYHLVTSPLYPFITTTNLTEPELPPSTGIKLNPSLHMEIINLCPNVDPALLPSLILELLNQLARENTKDYYKRFPVNPMMKMTHPHLTSTIGVPTVGLPLLVFNPITPTLVSAANMSLLSLHVNYREL